jgi:site-specific recombinase XerD
VAIEDANELVPAADQGLWPAVAQPHRLLGEITEWLSGYGNLATRRTYAEGLGLPTSPADLREWITPTTGQRDSQWDDQWANEIARYANLVATSGPANPAVAKPAEATSGAATSGPVTFGAARFGPVTFGAARFGPVTFGAARFGPVTFGAARFGSVTSGAATHAPPAAPRGRFRSLHWFRWCATRGIDPLAATSTQVKTWLADLDTAGAAPATRDRMLATVKALYAHLADTGLSAGNPAALNRRRLGLVTPSGSTTTTVVLTTAQVRALLTAAATARRGASLLDTARATAVVALFTLGLRVGELCALDRADLHVTRGRRALRVHGKGGKTRVVYLHEAAERALLDYLRLREQPTTSATPATSPARPDRTAPLLVTRTGGRYRRQSVWQLLRRIATAAGDPLGDVAGAMHPHALRHFYVTTAVEAGAQLVHVQADVGHTSVDTTEQVYNNAARDPSRSAVDLVGDTLRA